MTTLQHRERSRTPASAAAFIVQGFVLIGLAGVLRQVMATAEIKAVVVATGGVAGSFTLACDGSGGRSAKSWTPWRREQSGKEGP